MYISMIGSTRIYIYIFLKVNCNGERVWVLKVRKKKRVVQWDKVKSTESETSNQDKLVG